MTSTKMSHTSIAHLTPGVTHYLLKYDIENAIRIQNLIAGASLDQHAMQNPVRLQLLR